MAYVPEGAHGMVQKPGSCTGHIGSTSSGIVIDDWPLQTLATKGARRLTCGGYSFCGAVTAVGTGVA